MSDHNGARGRAVPVEALERAVNHFIARRKFTVPGNAVPITSGSDTLAFYVPVPAYTNNAVFRCFYYTSAPTHTGSMSISVDWVTEVTSYKLPSSPASTITSAREVIIPFSIGSNSGGDEEGKRVLVKFTASAEYGGEIATVTIVSSQINLAPVVAVTV